MADPFAKYAEPPSAEPASDDPFAKYAEKPNDATKPKESGIIGWAKGKMAESEARRQEMMKNPGKAIAMQFANSPILPTAIGSMVRAGREFVGNQTPYAIERILPDPTAGSVLKGFVDPFIKGSQIGQHAYDAATGGNGQGLGTDRLANWVDEAYRTPGVVQSQMGEMVGQSLLPLSIGAKGKSAIEGVKKANLLIRALKGGATGAAIGVSSTPDVGVQSNDDFARRQVMPALVGGGLGAVVPTALGAVESMASRRLTPEAQAIQDLGDRFGVRTLVPDLVSNRPGLAKSAVLAESVPGSGMVKQRVSQQAEARAAAQKLLDQHGIEGDIPEIIQSGLASKLAKGKANSRAAYDQVSKLSDPLGDAPVDTTLQAIQNFKAKQASAVVPNEGLIALLEKMETRLSDPAVNKTYTGLRGLRSDLGSMVSDYYKGANTATGSKGVEVLQGIKRAVEVDLDKFAASNGPEIAAAAKRADSIYKSEVLPAKARVVAKALGPDAEPDRIYQTIVSQGKSRADKFYQAMTPEAQAAVRSQMVKDAFEASTVQDGVFSPAKFAQSLEKIKDSTGVFFKGQDKFELDGFSNLMRHIQRAGQVNENPTNGSRLLWAIMAGEGAGTIGRLAGHGPEAGVAGAATAATAVGAARTLTKLFSSKAGKSLLLGASGTNPGTPAMEKLVEKDLPRLLGLQASAPNVSPLRTLPTAASTEPNTTLAENQP